MDELELEYIRENTKILRSLPVIPHFQQRRNYPFRALFEDNDKIGLSHVLEGRLFIGMVEFDPEETRRILLEKFPQYAEGLADAREGDLPFKIFRMPLAIGKVLEQTHSVRKPLPFLRKAVLSEPTNRKSIILQTVQDHWEFGVLEAVMRLMRPPEGNPKQD